MNSVIGVEYYGIGANSTRWVVIGDNLFNPSGGSIPVALRPQNPNVYEVVHDVICERNWVKYSLTPTQSATGIYAGGSDMTVRNNLLDMSNTDGVTAVQVSRNGTAPAPSPDNVRVYGNDIYYSDTDNDFIGVSITATATNAVVKNNLCYAPNDSQHTAVSDAGAGSVVANNSSDAQVLTDPKFSGALTAVTGWKITDATSYTKNAGASVPVWRDFFGVVRVTGSMDIGASEQ
jgi:hypothetical protein